MGDGVTDLLLTALTTLAPTAPPERLEPILRRALMTLLEEPAPATSQPLARRIRVRRDSSTTNLGDIDPLKTGTATNVEPAPAPEAWSSLRDRVLLALATRHMTRRQLCDEVGILPATLKPTLCPRGPPLGPANRQRLAAWLESIEAHTAANGSAQPEKKTYTLTTTQREKLAGWRSLEPERTLRTEIGLSAEVIDSAISGQHLAPEIIARLSGFLAEHAAPKS